MKFHRKIFLTMALTIVGISIVFVALTHLVVSTTIEASIENVRGKEVALLESELSDYYLRHNHSWEGMKGLDLLQRIDRDNPSILVMDHRKQTILQQGDSSKELIARLGVGKDIVVQGKSVGRFFYYDPEVASFNKILIGIPISVIIVLIGSGALLILLALVIAYQLSRWLTSPLKALLPSIERLGKGELGVQADVKVKDEYGKIAEAFNQMSAKLRQAEELRRNISADVAHELRTPLTIIGGKLDDLQQQGRPVSPEQLLPLQDELIRLNRLVEDLRTLSLAEAGQLRLNKMDTDMAELARRLCSAVEPLAEEQEISVHLEVLTDRTIVSADPNRIKQVLVNLLTNAIRYTPRQGDIFVRLLNDDDRKLALIVEDTGMGIAAEHLGHLFDRFYRADEARSRESGGTGLGLAIAKQYVLLHQGTIEVESRVDQGTRFTVELPLN
ncbi:MAG: ATP-binding protein [Paenibacillus macerans]|uniref:sensor histidine kinase n=1 Tax=Paenibacillus macerans TaxID=44252 RepID=UPI002914C210|nr:ATP-binding protein [Paenibacillus macerans]MDU7472320.1 ATP-binding protein [Paenibacillus macerans]